MKHFNELPEQARATYYWDVRYMILDGIFNGAAFQMLNFVARKTIGISEASLSIIIIFGHIGPMISFMLPILFPIRRKTQFVFWMSTLCKVFFILMAVSTGPIWFSILASAAMFFVYGHMPMYTAILKNRYPDSQRATIVAHVRALSMVATVVSSLIAGQLLKMDGEYFRIVFPAAALTGMWGTFLFLNIRDKSRPAIPSDQPLFSLQSLWKILCTDPVYVQYQLYFTIGGLANLAGVPIYVLYVVDRLNADYFQIALVAGVLNNIVSVLTLDWWGRFQDRYSNPMLLRSFIVMIWFIHPLLYAWANSIWLIYIAAGLYGFILGGGTINFMLGPLSFCHDKDAAAYTIIHQTIWGIRGILGPILGYTLYRTIGFTYTFYCLSFLMFLSGILMFRLFIKTKNDSRFQTRT